MNARLANHQRIALALSGGKDSLACVHLLKEHLDRITIYHVDAGDLLPELRDSVARVAEFAPRFVTIQTDVGQWIARHGLPSDLVPYTGHPIGRAFGQTGTPLVSRYDCCAANLMRPLWVRIKADGCTLLIRGTKRADFPRLPAYDGTVEDGIEIYHPIEEWTHQQVFDFLSSRGVPIPRTYENSEGWPGDCAGCTAWLSERRGRYLKRYHPQLFEIYQARLRRVVAEIAPVLAQLRQEEEVS